MIGIFLALILQAPGSGVIYGRVIDFQGQPAVAAEVQALTVEYEDGRRTLTLAQSTRTNDLGEYRMFWLAPARYVLKVAYPGGRASPFPLVVAAETTPGNGDDASFRQTRPASSLEYSRDLRIGFFGIATYYYRGVIDPQAASLVTVRAGSETGIDIEIAPARLRQVKGEIVDGTTGQFVPNVKIPFGVSTSNNRGGFVLSNVPPGDQVMFVTTSSGGKTMLARVMLNVGDAGLSDVRVTLNPAIHASGGIAGGNSDSSGVRVRLLTPLEDSVTPEPEAISSSGGAFTLDQIIAGVNYVVRVTLPVAWRNAYVKSIRLDGLELPGGRFRMDTQQDRPLEIVIGHDGGALDGRASVGATVVLVPAHDLRRRYDLYKSAAADASGRFHLEGVAPGDYALLAWEHTPNGAWQDPEFMLMHEARGIPIRIDAGASLTVDVQPISENAR